MDSLNVLTSPVLSLLKDANLLKSLIRHKLIEEILDNEILEKKDNLAVENIIKNRKSLKTDQDFLEWKKNNQSEYQVLSKDLSIPFRLDNYALKNFGHMAEARYLEKKDLLDQVCYSLIRVQEAFLAYELYLRVLEEEVEFRELAKEFSLGPEKDSCGVVGPIPINQSSKEIIDILKSSNLNEVNKPIKIGEIHVIIRVESRIMSNLNKDTELILSKELFSEWLEEEANKIETNLTNPIALKEI